MERRRNFRYDITALCVVVALAAVVGRDYAGTHHIYWMAIVSSFLVDLASVVYFLCFIGSLRSWKSPVMRVFRIGGDEFMAILLPADEESGKAIIDKANENFAKKSNELGMTISAASGITTRLVNEDVRAAMQRVDEAMYACKQRYYQQTDNDRRK